MQNKKVLISIVVVAFVALVAVLANYSGDLFKGSFKINDKAPIAGKMNYPLVQQKSLVEETNPMQDRLPEKPIQNSVNTQAGGQYIDVSEEWNKPQPPAIKKAYSKDGYVEIYVEIPSQKLLTNTLAKTLVVEVEGTKSEKFTVKQDISSAGYSEGLVYVKIPNLANGTNYKISARVWNEEKNVYSDYSNYIEAKAGKELKAVKNLKATKPYYSFIGNYAIGNDEEYFFLTWDGPQEDQAVSQYKIEYRNVSKNTAFKEISTGTFPKIGESNNWGDYVEYKIIGGKGAYKALNSSDQYEVRVTPTSKRVEFFDVLVDVPAEFGELSKQGPAASIKFKTGQLPE